MARKISINKSRTKNFFQSITVEPMVLLTMLAMQISQVIQQVGIYRVICEQSFAGTGYESQVDCGHISGANISIHNMTAEIYVQKRMSTWNLGLGVTYLIPALFADVLLGAYGDRYGRKINFLLGITGLLVTLFSTALVFASPRSVPLWTVLIAHVISGLTGYISIIKMSAAAYLADTITDHRDLTFRVTIMQICISSSDIIGPFIASQTLKSLTQAQGMVICELLCAIAFFYCMARIRQVPPAELRRRLKAKWAADGKIVPASPPSARKANNVDTPTPEVNSNVCKTVFSTAGSLLKETWHTYTKSREGHVRLYLLCTANVFLLNIVSELVVRVRFFGMFVQKAPLNWHEDMIGYYKSIQAGVHLIGTAVGIVVFKKWLNLSDTFIILIAATSHVVETAIMAFATESWIVFASVAGGVLSGLSMPCTQSFVAKLVGASEVGKAYTAFGISANVGFLFASAVYNPIYYATVDFFPGFVFVVATIILIFAWFIVLWLHIDSHFSTMPNEIGFRRKFMQSIFSSTRESKIKPVPTASNIEQKMEVENLEQKF